MHRAAADWGRDFGGSGGIAIESDVGGVAGFAPPLRRGVVAEVWWPVSLCVGCARLLSYFYPGGLLTLAGRGAMCGASRQGPAVYAISHR